MSVSGVLNLSIGTDTRNWYRCQYIIISFSQDLRTVGECDFICVCVRAHAQAGGAPLRLVL